MRFFMPLLNFWELMRRTAGRYCSLNAVKARQLALTIFMIDNNLPLDGIFLLSPC